MGKASSPFITSAGRDHVILSKQFAIVIGTMIMCATVIFVRIEQGAVKTAMKNAAHVKENTVNLKKKNTDLQEIQKQLQADEDELTKMYEKWLDDDGKKMATTKTQISELKEKIDAVMKSQDTHSDLLGEKEDVLNAKEDVLTDLHVQLRQKNTMMKQMKMQIRKLNGTLPELLANQPDDDDWAW
jgi:chromosome segregation ATPase